MPLYTEKSGYMELLFLDFLDCQNTSADLSLYSLLPFYPECWRTKLLNINPRVRLSDHR